MDTSETTSTAGETRSTVIRAAQAGTREARQAALRALCQQSYPSVEAAFRAYRPKEVAMELSQAFALELMTTGVDSYDRSRGRFRPWLLGRARHFLFRQWKYDRRAKRDVRKTLSFDPFEQPWIGSQARSAEAQVDSQRAALLVRELIEGALQDTRAWHAKRGKLARFERLSPYIPGDEISDLDYAAAAADLGLEPGAVRKAVHDLRIRYRKGLRNRLTQRLPVGAHVDSEIARLLAHLSEVDAPPSDTKH